MDVDELEEIRALDPDVLGDEVEFAIFEVDDEGEVFEVKLLVLEDTEELDLLKTEDEL